MAQYGFYFDNTRCTGCRTCEIACKDYKDLAVDFAFRRVYDYEGGAWEDVGGGSYATGAFVYHVSAACNHCMAPACLPVCPQAAIAKDASTGAVLIDEEKCIGCGACVTACPYTVPKVDESTMKSKKCNFCFERITEDLAPICVQSCPLRALDYGDVDDLRATHEGFVAGIAPLPSPDETGPSLVIKPSPAAKTPGDTTGFVANAEEIALVTG